MPPINRKIYLSWYPYFTFETVLLERPPLSSCHFFALVHKGEVVSILWFFCLSPPPSLCTHMLGNDPVSGWQGLTRVAGFTGSGQETVPERQDPGLTFSYLLPMLTAAPFLSRLSFQVSKWKAHLARPLHKGTPLYFLSLLDLLLFGWLSRAGRFEREE